MKRNVADWYMLCDECVKGKGPPLRPHRHLQKIQIGAPLDLVTLDILSVLMRHIGAHYLENGL